MLDALGVLPKGKLKEAIDEAFQEAPSMLCHYVLSDSSLVFGLPTLPYLFQARRQLRTPQW